MTVCVASKFLWNHANADEAENFQSAIITAADRMLTDPGISISYEHNLQKRVFLAPKVVGLVAGSVSIHTAIIPGIVAEVRSGEESDPRVIAEIYARHLRNYLVKRSETLYLAPFGLTLEKFTAAQNGLSPDLARDLNEKLFDYARDIDFEALIVGIAPDTRPCIATIDRMGIVSFHDDIGFAAIGEGGIHAAGHFMQSDFFASDVFFRAAWRTFCAKKRAETAASVGRYTDMTLVTQKAVWTISRTLIDAMEKRYEADEKRRLAQLIQSAERLRMAEPRIPIFDLEEPGHGEEAAPEPRGDEAALRKVDLNNAEDSAKNAQEAASGRTLRTETDGKTTEC